MSEKDKEDKFLISLSDVLALFRKNRAIIIYCTLIFALAGFFYALTRPIKYKAEGTFKEKGNTSSGLSSSLAQMFSTDIFTTGSAGEASSVFKSRKLLQEVIEKLHLQGIVTRKCDEEGVLTRIRRNFHTEWASFRKYPYPVLKDLNCPIQIESIHYPGEIPVMYEVFIQPNGQYELFNFAKEKIGEGRLNEPFSCSTCSFTLSKTLADAPNSDHCYVHLLPLSDMAKLLANNLEIDNTKNDKSTLKISYEHRNRHLASRVVNTMMECYQDYLEHNHQRISSIQLNYLQTREEESARKLKNLMEKHAEFLVQDLSTVGFANSKKEMDFLAESEHRFKDKLLANELEIKRLSNIKSVDFVHYDQYSNHHGVSNIINNILSQIRSHKQEQDSLEVALRESSLLNPTHVEQALDQRLNEIQKINRYANELETIIVQFDQGLIPDLNSSLMSDKRFVIRSWFEKLSHTENEESNQKIKESLSFYLNNLRRLFQVHEKILQDRLIYQQNASNEYQGISLESAKGLYLEYCRRLLEIESNIRQNEFFITQLMDPDFEVSSLSINSIDFVSLDMIKRASELTLRLKDQSNQSMREQERLKQELALQRAFLVMHLEQMVQVFKLNKQLIDEKIFSLQLISLEVVRQTITLLEKNLIEYIESHLENLLQEKEVLQQHINDIHLEMAALPQKWVAEQLIEQQVETNQLIVQEIAKLVESKNISHNLELIQSAPLDRALPSLHPILPGLRFFTSIGAVIGVLMSCGFILVRSLVQGIAASPENLKIMHQHVAGSLSFQYDPSSKEPIKDEDLDTLRRLHSYLDQSRNVDKKPSLASVLLAIEGKGPDYTKGLANLMIKKGEKVVRIQLDFDHPHSSNQPGLLQYLQGEVKQPPILKGDAGDYIVAGGFTRFSIELLGSPLFHALIEQLKTQYEWIIAVTHALPHSAEAESLVPLFPCIVVALEDEKLDQLTTYLDLDPKQKTVVFMFIDTDKRFS